MFFVFSVAGFFVDFFVGVTPQIIVFLVVFDRRFE